MKVREDSLFARGLFRYRKGEYESRAPTGRGFDANLTAMRDDQLFDYGKSQPGSARCPAAGLFAAVETLEDVWEIFGTDTLTRIADGHLHAGPFKDLGQGPGTGS